MAAIGAFSAEQAFHAIEGDIGEQGRNDSALRRPHLAWLQPTKIDHASLQPTPDGGGEDRQTRQQHRVLETIERAYDRLPTTTRYGHCLTATDALLRSMRCARFLGNIASPLGSASPVEAVKALWDGELPEFESLDAVNDLLGGLVNADHRVV